MALGDNIVTTVTTDRITVDATCLRRMTLDEFVEGLKSITSHIRIHGGSDPRVEIYFRYNDLERYGDDFVKKVTEYIAKHTYRVLLFSAEMTLSISPE